MSKKYTINVNLTAPSAGRAHTCTQVVVDNSGGITFSGKSYTGEARVLRVNSNFTPLSGSRVDDWSKAMLAKAVEVCQSLERVQSVFPPQQVVSDRLAAFRQAYLDAEQKKSQRGLVFEPIINKMRILLEANPSQVEAIEFIIRVATAAHLHGHEAGYSILGQPLTPAICLAIESSRELNDAYCSLITESTKNMRQECKDWGQNRIRQVKTALRRSLLPQAQPVTALPVAQVVVAQLHTPQDNQLLVATPVQQPTHSPAEASQNGGGAGGGGGGGGRGQSSWTGAAAAPADSVAATTLSPYQKDLRTRMFGLQTLIRKLNGGKVYSPQDHAQGSSVLIARSEKKCIAGYAVVQVLQKEIASKQPSPQQLLLQLKGLESTYPALKQKGFLGASLEVTKAFREIKKTVSDHCKESAFAAVADIPTGI